MIFAFGISLPLLTSYSSLPETQIPAKKAILIKTNKKNFSDSSKNNFSSDKIQSNTITPSYLLNNILPLDKLFSLSDTQKQKWEKICEKNLKAKQNTFSDLEAREEIEAFLDREQAIQYYWYLILYKKKF